jgi:uncharacterized membrane protein HdeD (DUF308 family)
MRQRRQYEEGFRMNTRNTGSAMGGMNAALKQLTDNWWLLLLQGIVSIIFGILALVWPASTLVVLIVLFGWLALINGIIAIISAFGSAASQRAWGWRFASGIFGVLAGLIILRWPGETAFTLLLFVGFWVILVGLVQIIGAIADHAEIPHAWWLAIEGVVSILFGIAMVVWPVAGLLALTLLIGIYAIVHGILYCVMAFRVRSLGQRLAARPSPSQGTPAY